MRQASAARKAVASEMPVPNEKMGGEFDLRTHFFDSSGRFLGKNPYRLHIGNFGELYERPAGSGNCFTSDGKPAGRMIYKVDADGIIQGGKTHDPKAAHIEYVAPLKGAEKIVADLAAEKQRSAALEAELAAIKGEKKPQQQAPPSLKGDKQ